MKTNDNYHAAIVKFKDSLKAWKVLDENGSHLPTILQKLGLVCLRSGDNKEAVDFLSESLDMLESQEGDLSEDSLIPSTLSGLAKAFSNAGSYDSAIAAYQRHVDLLKCDPSSREAVSDSLYAMGTIYARLNNLDDAVGHFKECLLLRKNTFGGTDERVARVLMNMGVVFEKQDDFTSAKDCFVEAVRIYKLNGNEQDTSSSLQDLGRTLIKQRCI